MKPVRSALPDAEHEAKIELSNDSSGHDWWHVHRVRNTAIAIALEEGADEAMVELIALLHDVRDVKLSGSRTAGAEFAHDFCLRHGLHEDVADEVSATIQDLSFKGAGVADRTLSLEGSCVRDADRLDAMGAVGIARAFAYGGRVGRPMWDPDRDPSHHATEDAYRAAEGTTVDHFHEKLFLLRDRMATETGRRRAARRHRLLERFLDDFYAEWRGDAEGEA